MERKTKIILTRKNSWLNRLRGYKVFLDGQLAGNIRNGASEEFEVTPGYHKVLCKINWVGSREYEVNVGGGTTEYLQVRSGMKYFLLFYALLLAFLGFQLYLDFSKAAKPAYYRTIELAGAIIIFAYFFYYLTIGRKDYLVIEKDSSNMFAS